MHSSHRMLSRSRCLLLAAVTVTAGAAVAQVPDGSYVVSTFGYPQRPGGGLWIVDPRTPGPPVAVTGLGPDLLGVPGAAQGANCVAVRPEDGALLVGELADAPGTQIDLHGILLSGSVAAVDVRIPIGVASPGFSGSGINSVAVLPGGDALIAVHGLQVGPPLHGEVVAIVRTDGTVVPVPLRGALPGGVANSIAADRAGTTGYVAIQDSSGSATVYAFPVPGGGVAWPLAVVNHAAALAIDSRGRILSTCRQPFFGIIAIDPGTGAQTPVGITGETPNGANLEAATDSPVYVLNGFGSAGVEVGWMDASGTKHVLTNQLTGVGSGIAVLNDPGTYGTSTPGTSDYRWQVAPNPGGLPRVGNAGFALQVAATAGGSPAGFLLASPREGRATVLGVHLLLDPAAIIPLLPLSASGTVPLPVPAGAPVGGRLFFQSFHLDAGAPRGIAASDGLRLTLLR